MTFLKPVEAVAVRTGNAADGHGARDARVVHPDPPRLELLYDSAGLLIPYSDPNGTALAEALNALLSSASLRTAMVNDCSGEQPCTSESLLTL